MEYKLQHISDNKKVWLKDNNKKQMHNILAPYLLLVNISKLLHFSTSKMLTIFGIISIFNLPHFNYLLILKYINTGQKIMFIKSFYKHLRFLFVNDHCHACEMSPKFWSIRMNWQSYLNMVIITMTCSKWSVCILILINGLQIGGRNFIL